MSMWFALNFSRVCVWVFRFRKPFSYFRKTMWFSWPHFRPEKTPNKKHILQKTDSLYDRDLYWNSYMSLADNDWLPLHKAFQEGIQIPRQTCPILINDCNAKQLNTISFTTPPFPGYANYVGICFIFDFWYAQLRKKLFISVIVFFKIQFSD